MGDYKFDASSLLKKSNEPKTSSLIMAKALQLLTKPEDESTKKNAMNMMKFFLAMIKEQELTPQERRKAQFDTRDKINRTNYDIATSTLLSGAGGTAGQAGATLLAQLTDQKSKLESLYDMIGTREYNIARKTETIKNLGIVNGMINLLNLQSQGKDNQDLGVAAQLMQVSRLMAQEELARDQMNDVSAVNMTKLKFIMEMLSTGAVKGDAKKKLEKEFDNQLKEYMSGGSDAGFNSQIQMKE